MAWSKLCNHYDGPAEGDKHITIARNDIKILHYKNESSFSFEQYSTRLRKAFLTLEQYEQPKHEKEMVETLLDQMNTNDNRLVTAIGICHDSHGDTFDNASTYMSQQIVVIYPQHQPNAFGKTGRGGRRPRPRQISGVKRRNGKSYFNGVDISDTTGYYSAKEFNKLGEEGRKILYNDPKRKNWRKNRTPKQNKGNDSGQDENNRHVAAIINGIMQANRNASSASTATGTTNTSLPPMSQHGPHARPPVEINQVRTTQSSSDQSRASVVTYDHNGNVL